MDLTLIIYMAARPDMVPQLLAEIFAYSEDLSVELIAVDGLDVQVDYEKLGAQCAERGIEFTVIRQEPLNRMAPGYHKAAATAQGEILVFLNPLISIPPDFLRMARFVGRYARTVLLRPWVNVIMPTGECCGFFAPPDNCSLIMPRKAYAAGALGEAVWTSTTWPKADAYVLVTKLVKYAGIAAGIVTMCDYEYRSWVTQEQAEPYTGDMYPNAFVVDWSQRPAGTVDAHDIRRHICQGVPFEEVCAPVAGFQSAEELEGLVRQALSEMSLTPGPDTGLAEFVPMIQRELDAVLDTLFCGGQLMFWPSFVVEPDEEASTIRVRSTGDVLLPYERMVG